MLKKIIVFLSFAFILCFSAFAYNPPMAAEDSFLFASPFLTSGNAVGGGLLNPGVWSNEQNPALTAGNQRWQMELGYGGIIGEKLSDIKSASGFGSALRLGLLFPTRYGVFSGAVQGAFGMPENSGLGNHATIRAGFAKDITDEFWFGASLWGGIQLAPNAWDFGIALDAGAYLKLGSWSFLKDMRLGIVLSNLGKTYKAAYGIFGSRDKDSFYPAYVSPKVAFAANLLTIDNLHLAFSSGLAFPTFQNAVFDIGFDAVVFKYVTVNAGWQIDLRETIQTKQMRIPYVGLQFTFTADTSGAQFLANRGWDSTDFTVSALYKNLGKSLNQLTAGAVANFGIIDREGPELKLGD
ncbi:MAG: hypothetical protein LBM77_06985 [Spirochaetaceae bacterium]|jgi:hypothetical protein|nr:hypothetical protein [Spirochaetaceae bacterium]